MDSSILPLMMFFIAGCGTGFFLHILHRRAVWSLSTDDEKPVSKTIRGGLTLRLSIASVMIVIALQWSGGSAIALGAGIWFVRTILLVRLAITPFETATE